MNADLTSAPQRGVQTVGVPAGGGGVFDVRIDDPGLYPVVSHSFATWTSAWSACSRWAPPRGR